MEQCIGNIRGVRCTLNASENNRFCNAHHQDSFKAYKQYKESSADFLELYQTYDQSQGSYNVNELRSLYIKCTRVYEQRLDFTKRFVHISCHDEGHAYQIEVHRDLARHFDRCLAWEYLHIENGKQHPRGKDALQKHRAHLVRCEEKKQKLLQDDLLLKQRWNQIKSVILAKQNLEKLREKKKNEIETMKVLQTCVSNNIKQTKLKLTKQIEQHKPDSPRPEWMKMTVNFLFMFLCETHPHVHSGDYKCMNEGLVQDLEMTCSLIRHFCVFFFGRSITKYTPFFRGLLSSFYFIQSLSLVTKFNHSKLVDAFELMFESSLCHALEHEQNMIIERNTQLRSLIERKGSFNYIKYITSTFTSKMKTIRLDHWFDDIMFTSGEQLPNLPETKAMTMICNDKNSTVKKLDLTVSPEHFISTLTKNANLTQFHIDLIEYISKRVHEEEKKQSPCEKRQNRLKNKDRSDQDLLSDKSFEKWYNEFVQEWSKKSNH